MGILTDLFPNVEQNLRVIKEQLPYKVFCEVCQKNNLQPTKLLFTKLLQTYEIMNTCHSFVVVGKSFSCKTILLKVLTKILSVKNDSVQFDLGKEFSCNTFTHIIRSQITTLIEPFFFI